MALRYVTLILDAYDASGAFLSGGSASIAPNTVLSAPADTEWVPSAPVTAAFTIFAAAPTVRLLATDNADISPSGWAYTVSFTGVSGNPAAFSFFIPAGPWTFTATNASPCVFTSSGTAPANNTAVTLAGGSLPAGFNSTTTYYVVNQSALTFELAATLAGTPLGSTGSGSGTATGTSYHLSAVTPLATPPAVVQYLPAPGGTAVAGYVPQATGSGENSTWVSPAAAVLPLTTLGDTLYENATPAAARLPGNTSATKQFLTQTGTGSASAAPAWAGIVSGDLPTGTTSAQGALQLDGTTGDIQAAPGTAAAGSSGLAADAKHVHPQPTNFAPTGLTGATSASRYVGATTSGAPASGTFAKGDFVIDQTAAIWICTTAGTVGSGAVFTAVSGGGAQGLWQPSVNGLLAATFDFDAAMAAYSASGGVGAGFQHGQLQLVQLMTAKSITFSNIWLWQAAAATSPTYMAVGVYNSSGTRLAQTSDQSGTGWTAFQTGVALGSSVAASPASPVWIGILCAATTSPNCGQVVGIPTSTVVSNGLNIGLSAASYRIAQNGSGLSTLPPSITPASNNILFAALPWVGVS